MATITKKPLQGAIGVGLSYTFGKNILVDDVKSFTSKFRAEKNAVRESGYPQRQMSCVLVNTIEINKDAEKALLIEIKDTNKNNSMKLNFIFSRHPSKDVKSFIKKAKKETNSTDSTSVEIKKDVLRIGEVLENVLVLTVGVIVVIYGDTRPVYDFAVSTFKFKLNTVMILGLVFSVYPWLLKPLIQLLIQPLLEYLINKFSKKGTS